MRRTTMHSRTLAASVWTALALLTGACGGAAVDQPRANPVVFNVDAVLNATVGQPFTHSFCRPNLTSSAALCTRGEHSAVPSLF